MFVRCTFCLLLVWFVADGSAPADERVVLRQTKGDKTLPPRFYQVYQTAPPAAKAFFPTKKDTFEQLQIEKTDGPSIVYRDSFGWPFVPKRPVVVYNFDEVSPSIRGALGVAIRAVALAELNDKAYDKKRVKKKEEYIKLPAPTLRNWKRTKRHRILATQEEYRIQARLDGEPVIRITSMPYLKEKDRPERGVVMFVAHAELPVAGRVRYKVPSVLNVTTAYRAKVVLDLVAEIRARRDGERIHLDALEVLRVDIRLVDLDLSNDLLNAASKPIRDFINEETRRKHDKIRRQANKAVRKAVDDQTFRVPLLKYLLP